MPENNNRQDRFTLGRPKSVLPSTQPKKGVCRVISVRNIMKNRNHQVMIARYVAVVALVGVSMALPRLKAASSQGPEIGTKSVIASHQEITERFHPAPMTQTVYAPTIGVQSFSKAELVLNNNSPNGMEVTPTF